jgi:hypothetical protein
MDSQLPMQSVPITDRFNYSFYVMMFNATFSYIVEVSFIGEGNRRKPLTCRKSH